MEKKAIIEILEENGFNDIEELEYKENDLVIRFYYDFDEASIEAAKAYANDESGEEEGSDDWENEFFLPYLNDLAVDEVGEILEEIMEDMNVDDQFVSYELDSEELSNEFIAAFFPKGNSIDIEQILDALEL